MQDLTESMYSEATEVVQRMARRDGALGTLSASDVAHEVLLRVLTDKRELPRAQLKAYVGKAVHRVLVETARRKHAQKRDRGGERVQLAPDMLVDDSFFQTLAVEDAFRRLEKLNPKQAQAVEMRWFAGADTEEIAEALGLSVRSARDYLRFGIAWIKAHMDDDDGPE